MLLLAALQQMLLQKNGASGISHKYPGCRDENVAGAVMHLDPATEKVGIAGHTTLSFKAGGNGVNSTEGLPRVGMWKKRESRRQPWTAGKTLTFSKTGILSAFQALCSE